MGTKMASAVKHSPFYTLAVIFGKKVLFAIALVLSKLSSM